MHAWLCACSTFYTVILSDFGCIICYCPDRHGFNRSEVEDWISNVAAWCFGNSPCNDYSIFIVFVTEFDMIN